MTTDRDFDRLARAWLELGPDEAPDRVVAAVLQASEVTPQVRRRLGWPTWRPFQMNRLVLLGATAVLLVAFIGGGVLIGGGRLLSTTTNPSRSPAPSGALREPGLGINLRAVTPLSSIAVGGFPSGTGAARIASDGTTIWVTKDAEIVGIDPTTGAVRTRFPIGPGSYSWPIAVSPGAIWTDGAAAQSDSVTRWDPKTGKAVASVPVLTPNDPFFANGAIWVPERNSGAVVRIDPTTNNVTATIKIGTGGTTALGEIGASSGSVWVPDLDDHTIARVDPATNKVTGTFQVGVAPDAITGTDSLLLGTFYNDQIGVARYNAASGATTWNTPFDGGITNLLVHSDALWVGFQPHSAAKMGAIVAIDPASGTVIDGVAIPDGQVTALFEGFGSVWVVLGQQGIVERFSPDVLAVSH